jgi:hypothetical protein
MYKFDIRVDSAHICGMAKFEQVEDQTSALTGFDRVICEAVETLRGRFVCRKRHLLVFSLLK